MEKNYAFKIVVAGEDSAAVMRAQELSERLATELKPEFEINSDVWDFEALGRPQMGEAAAREVVQANMIIIAASGAAEPPAPVKIWFESWLPQKRNDVTALVALLDYEAESPRESSPLCAYLQRMAGKWGMDFFSNSADWRQQFPESTAEPLQRQQEIPQLEMNDAFDPNYAWRYCALDE